MIMPLWWCMFGGLEKQVSVMSVAFACTGVIMVSPLAAMVYWAELGCWERCCSTCELGY
jgi:hypothetical protein